MVALMTMIVGDDLSLHLPNVRSLFIPGRGRTYVEADLARADACVAAWDADAKELKQQVLDGVDLHSDNAQLLYGTRWTGRKFETVREIAPRTMHSNGMSYRDNAKRWVHATNFHGGADTVASVIVVDKEHVKACQQWWTEARHPEIGRWHRRIQAALNSRKMPVIHNAFGFHRMYVGGSPYGRSDGNLLGQALGWICQSTVAIVINRGIERIDCNLDLIGRPRCGDCLVCHGREWELRLQVHDSILTTIPTPCVEPVRMKELISALTIRVPYDDPLYIPVEIKYSHDNWGNMKKWTDDSAAL